MTLDHVTWLISMGLALATALVVMGFGVFLLRHVIEDLSNSTTAPAFMVRFYRSMPGFALLGFSGWLIWRIFDVLLKAQIP